MSKRKSKRRATRKKSRGITLVGSLLLMVSIFVPSIGVGIVTPPGQFPSFTGTIVWPWLDIFGILALIMGIIALIGVLIDTSDVSMILVVLGGVIGLIVGIIGLFMFLTSGIILALAPSCAFLGGLLALLGALRVRI
ncbi:MAG: hypothetical protein ACTSSA_02730 [Candidatus Freyarchaeota archaeon]